MTSPAHERPFRVDQRAREWPGLNGAFFDFVSEIPSLRDAYYVWGGPYCGFDDMIAFVNSTTRTDGHRFIVAGLLFQLEYRLHENTIASASFLEDRIRVIGPRVTEDETSSPTDALRIILEPFTRRAWTVLGICIVVLLTARIWLSIVFASNLTTFWDSFMGTFRSVENERFETLNRYWVTSVKLFIGVTVIFWEFGIVNFVFAERHYTPLRNFNPERFGVTRNSTQERIFSNLVGSDSNWSKYADIGAVYNALHNQTDNVDYAISYDIMNRYLMNQNPDLCENMTVYADSTRLTVNGRNLPRFAGVWYYSGNINLSRRIEIDRDIVTLREQGRIREIVNSKAKAELNEQCKPKNRRINELLIGIPLLILPGSLLLVVLYANFVHSIRRLIKMWHRRRWREETLGEEALT